MPMAPPPDIAALSLAEIADLAANAKLPPVASWNPSHCGDSDMRIAADGTWYHQGEPIRRPAMVTLFSHLLRREPDGGHVLVTPAEKLSITVDDAPFVATAVEARGTGQGAQLAFQLNTGDVVLAGPDHRLRVEERDGSPRPYLHVRDGLEALVSRAVFYDLAERATLDGDGPAGVWSAGVFFPLEPGR